MAHKKAIMFPLLPCTLPDGLISCLHKMRFPGSLMKNCSTLSFPHLLSSSPLLLSSLLAVQQGLHIKCLAMQGQTHSTVCSQLPETAVRSHGIKKKINRCTGTCSPPEGPQCKDFVGVG